MPASRFNRTTVKTANARRLRREATTTERLVWSRLRSGQVDGASFRKQHPAGRYTLDFYCPALRLAVEVDGDSHGLRAGWVRDKLRDVWLRANGVLVLRFWNSEVAENLEGVVETIWDAIVERRADGTRRSAMETA